MSAHTVAPEPRSYKATTLEHRPRRSARTAAPEPRSHTGRFLPGWTTTPDHRPHRGTRAAGGLRHPPIVPYCCARAEERCSAAGKTAADRRISSPGAVVG